MKNQTIVEIFNGVKNGSIDYSKLSLDQKISLDLFESLDGNGLDPFVSGHDFATNQTLNAIHSSVKDSIAKHYDVGGCYLLWKDFCDFKWAVSPQKQKETFEEYKEYVKSNDWTIYNETETSFNYVQFKIECDDDWDKPQVCFKVYKQNFPKHLNTK